MNGDQHPNAPIVKEVVLNAPVQKVWKAITDKDEMRHWYFKIESFEPEVGYEFHFYGEGHKGEQYLHRCRITEVVVFKKLQYTWSYENYKGLSTVTFELFEEGLQTRLRLTHEGLETFPDHSEDFAKESFNEGWTYLIEKSIREYLETRE